MEINLTGDQLSAGLFVLAGLISFLAAGISYRARKTMNGTWAMNLSTGCMFIAVGMLFV